MNALPATDKPPAGSRFQPDAAEVTLPDLYGGFVLLRLIYVRLGNVLTVPGACLAWALVQAGLFAGLCWAQGTLFIGNAPGELTLLEDTTALAYFFLLPLCFLLLYYSLRLFRRYLNRLDDVLEPASLPDSRRELLAFARDQFAPAHVRKARRVFLALGLLIVLFNVLTNLYPEFFYGSPRKWDGSRFPVSYVAMRFYVLFVWGYAIPTWAAEVTMQFLAMARLHQVMARRGWLRVTPYAQDGFGGLKGLAVSASWVGYLILAAGVFFLAPLLRRVVWDLPLHAGNYVGIGLYLLCAATGILAPVYLLHRILARKREEVLNFLNGAFAEINARVERLVKENDTRGLGEEGLGRALETVDRLHTRWSALPTWPMTVDALLKFLVTVVVPAVGYFVVQQFLKQLSP